MKTANEKLEFLDKVLDEYVKSKGLTISLNSEIEEYLNIRKPELNKLSADECGEAAIILTQYALYLQTEYNIEKTRVDWADAKIDNFIADKVNKHSTYSSYQERKAKTIKEDTYSQKLFDIKTYANSRAGRIAYVAAKVGMLSDRFDQLQQTRRHRRNI